MIWEMIGARGGDARALEHVIGADMDQGPVVVVAGQPVGKPGANLVGSEPGMALVVAVAQRRAGPGGRPGLGAHEIERAAGVSEGGFQVAPVGPVVDPAARDGVAERKDPDGVSGRSGPNRRAPIGLPRRTACGRSRSRRRSRPCSGARRRGAPARPFRSQAGRPPGTRRSWRASHCPFTVRGDHCIRARLAPGETGCRGCRS